MAKVEEYILILMGGMTINGQEVRKVTIYSDGMKFEGAKGEVLLRTLAIKEPPLYITGQLSGLSAGSAVRYYSGSNVLQLVDYNTSETIKELAVTIQK